VILVETDTAGRNAESNVAVTERLGKHGQVGEWVLSTMNRGWEAEIIDDENDQTDKGNRRIL
jgi:hypothetical protein